MCKSKKFRKKYNKITAISLVSAAIIIGSVIIFVAFHKPNNLDSMQTSNKNLYENNNSGQPECMAAQQNENNKDSAIPASADKNNSKNKNSFDEIPSAVNQNKNGTNFSDWNNSCELNLVVVNKDNLIPKSYNSNLVNYKNIKINSIAQSDLDNMINDAAKEGLKIYPSSGYRSVARQTTLFNNQVSRCKKQGYKSSNAELMAATVVARPGTSEHHTGLAIDFNGVKDDFYKTKEYLSKIENIIYETIDNKDLIAVYSLAGKQLDKNSVEISEELNNLAGTMIYLVPANNREKTAFDIIDDLNLAIDKSKIKEELELLTINTKLVINPGKAIDIKIIGNDTLKAQEVKNKMKEKLLSLSGVINYDDDDKVGEEELRVIFNYDKMSELGLNVSIAARELRAVYSGIVATSIQQFDNRLDFRVKLDEKYTHNTNTLYNLLIPNTYGRLIYLKDIATIQITNNKSSIMHYNGKKSITMTADIIQGENTALQVMYIMKDYFNSISKDYPGISVDFSGEVKETSGSIIGLAWGYLFAIIAIYVVLLLQFNKFVQPLMILGIIPFGIIGVILAFAIHKMPMSFVGGVGIVGLAGVVVNNGIIMIDLINRIIENGNIKDKKDVFNAVVEGASERFRAIFLTTITTIFGLLPTVYGIGGRADLIVPIVMALAYGLLFASLLTLILLPCLFMVSADLKLVKINYKD